MCNVSYEPSPIDTSTVVLPGDLLELKECLAENTHHLWASRRRAEGWSYGPVLDEDRKRHPRLVPYDQLPESEKEYDRTTAMEALKVVLALGYEIRKPETERGIGA